MKSQPQPTHRSKIRRKIKGVTEAPVTLSKADQKRLDEIAAESEATQAEIDNMDRIFKQLETTPLNDKDKLVLLRFNRKAAALLREWKEFQNKYGST